LDLQFGRLGNEEIIAVLVEDLDIGAFAEVVVGGAMLLRDAYIIYERRDTWS
jgi:hypothetical protein